ncbi:DUF2987 domain-containing protein [Vibrio sp. RC27]
MNKKTLGWLLLLCGTISSAPAISGQHVYMFHYSNFYNQLKHNSELDHPDVRVGLFFIEQDTRQACHLANARLEHKKHNETIEVYSTGEVELPIDTNLKKLNPLLYITSVSDEPCDISMKVLAREPLSEAVSIEHLSSLSAQMQTLLTQLSGSIGKWFTPEVNGIRLEFPTFESGFLVTSQGEEIEVINHKANIVPSDYDLNDTITLPEQTKDITPIVLSPQK